MIEEQTKELKDYLDAFRRRRTLVFTVFTVISLISVLIALLWPPTYRSTATILIEEQGIPDDMVRSTITTYAWQRIQTISQRVMGRTNLLEIVDKYKLYESKRARETTEEIIGRMRENIKLEPVSAQVIDPRSGRATTATIAFSLSFDGENPAVTQKVANELTTLYLNENIKSRTEKVAETYDFMTEEANRLGQQIAEYEEKLAAFKERNVNRLPELRDFNMQQMSRIETELRDLQNHIRSLEERKAYLQANLTQVQPSGPVFSESGQPVLNKEARLKSMKTEYAVASAKYSPEHPDVIRLKREIEGLEKQTGSVSGRQEQAKELTQMRGALAAAQEKYSSDHPDVIGLTRQIEALEASLRAPELPEQSVAAEKPDNPAYISLQTQLEGVEIDLRSSVVTREQLNAKLADYEKRIVQTPQVEREYANVARDLSNAREKYRDIKTKQMEAEVGQQMEKERKGERFSLIDPPQLPEAPIKPNRPGIFLLGLMLSVGAPLGYVVVVEGMDRTVRGTRYLSAALNTALLSIIPYKENLGDMVKKARVKKRIVTAVAVSLVVAVILAHLLWTPLDVLWFKGLRKAGGIIGS
jgi:uncharacterized protein involved in exopolysaccharide biosynthesis